MPAGVSTATSTTVTFYDGEPCSVTEDPPPAAPTGYHYTGPTVISPAIDRLGPDVAALAAVAAVGAAELDELLAAEADAAAAAAAGPDLNAGMVEEFHTAFPSGRR